MDHPSMLRRVVFVVFAGVWLFFLLSLGSFQATDWPSHAVYPYGPIKNVCGPAGAFTAYYLYLILGQGVLPILFFSGICIALFACGARITDLWLRLIGLGLLAVAFASVVHLIRRGSSTGFPEGNGGILGIGAAEFLRARCNGLLTALILVCSFIVGLLLCADDLVVRAPGVIGKAVRTVRDRAPAIGERLGSIRLPSFPRLVPLSRTTVETDEDAPATNSRQLAGPITRITTDDVDGLEDDEPVAPRRLPMLRPQPVKARRALKPTSAADELHLEYENDEPAAAAEDSAWKDDADPAPSAPATIPPPEVSQVVRPPAVVNTAASAAPVTPAVPARPAPVIKSAASKMAAATNTGVGLTAPPAPGQAMPVMKEVPIAAHDESEDEAESGDESDEDFESAIREHADQIKGVDPVASLSAAADGLARGAAALKSRQPVAPPRPKELGAYALPTWDHLDEAEHGYADAQEAFVREKAAVLEQALSEFNIDSHVVEIDTGPVITMYEISLAPGIKVSSITALQNDIARALSAQSVRIVAPIPGKNTVGIEVPNADKEKVRLKELMQLAPESTRKMAIPLYLGKDVSGGPLIVDLAKMPHCLIAGTTGSGKSVCINTIIMSIIHTQRPDHVKLILVDPKVVEMAPFKDIPHLLAPVINDAAKAISVLEWACEKMDERYELLAEAGVRSIAQYNQMTRDELVERFQPGSIEEEAKIPKFLPYWVIIIDELADLMMNGGKECEAFVVRLAQKARAVGIHLIVATQRPQASVVTGLIKANLPSKIAFRVNTRMDSRIVIDQNGAELLLGYGDMLYLDPTKPKPVRSQGTYIDDKEVKESVRIVKAAAEAQYEPELVQIKAKFNSDDMKSDDMFDDAVKVVLETKRGSVSLLQRRLNIGYGRAAKLIEMMAQAGLVGEYKGTQSREATITLEEWEQMKAGEAADRESGMTV